MAELSCVAKLGSLREERQSAYVLVNEKALGRHGAHEAMDLLTFLLWTPWTLLSALLPSVHFFSIHITFGGYFLIVYRSRATRTSSLCVTLQSQTVPEMAWNTPRSCMKLGFCMGIGVVNAMSFLSAYVRNPSYSIQVEGSIQVRAPLAVRSSDWQRSSTIRRD